MPELPEVETVRRTLARNLPGHRIIGVQVHRDSVVHGSKSPKALLAGLRVGQIERHGKQLAIMPDACGPSTGSPQTNRRCVCVHLGMTGSLRYSRAKAPLDPHCHVVWKLDRGAQLRFRDPRRFGGIWTFQSREGLASKRWNRLGPDALSIKPLELHVRLLKTRRAIKAALLDQHVLAGLGNIYVDECLFACRIHPAQPANQLRLDQVQPMVRHLRRILTGAIEAGGSSVRDYVDSNGRAGAFQQRHHVYGRAGLPCRKCKSDLNRFVLAGRTTVFCPDCQPRSNGVTY